MALSIDAPALGAYFAMATGTLATIIPSTPGYVGTFDLLTRLGFQAFAAPAVGATAVALSVHVLLWLPITLAGVLLILAPRTDRSPGLAYVPSETAE
jgi:uncharacterized membrane protein YbhN (UPF0104 family)